MHNVDGGGIRQPSLLGVRFPGLHGLSTLRGFILPYFALCTFLAGLIMCAYKATRLIILNNEAAEIPAALLEYKSAAVYEPFQCPVYGTLVLEGF